MSTKFNVYVRELLCKDGTESGNDEIYMNVHGYPTPYASSFVPKDVRIPKNKKQHWSINNDDTWYKIDYKLPWVWWSEPHGPFGGWQEQNDDRPLESGPGWGIHTLTFTVKESDDLSDEYIGKFSMRPMEGFGATWSALEHSKLQHDPRDPIMIVHCWGKNTDYRIKMEYVIHYGP